ncbi:hypothetical protein CEXT_380711 [Caerostris extrusa]|uniref:Uncharacterized protein n=1 Tax=Caerostris extrusa TaxID=172846 RepID=A0AAV4TRY4_CAEEX|nr:hypothetical protein CEXT_380711 [Caerostris extrusa]
MQKTFCSTWTLNSVCSNRSHGGPHEIDVNQPAVSARVSRDNLLLYLCIGCLHPPSVEVIRDVCPSYTVFAPNHHSRVK